jgi:anti-anti-sigma regulatory factor
MRMTASRNDGDGRPAATPAPGGRPGERVLRLPQPLDQSAQTALTRALDQAVHSDVQWLAIDLGALERLDDEVLALLLTLHSNAGRLRDRISLVGTSPAVVRQLAESGVSSLFHLGAAGHPPAAASRGPGGDPTD